MTGPSEDWDEFFNPGQSRAARGLLGWSVGDLATRSGISVADVTDYEAGRLGPVSFNQAADEIERVKRGRRAAEAIRSALEGGGADLVRPSRKGEGVRLRRAKSTHHSWSPRLPGE